MDAGSVSSASGGLEGTLSFVQLFMHADIVVKAVMALLILASLWSWAIIVQKTLALGRVNREANQFEAMLGTGRALDDIAAGLGTQPKEAFQKLLVIVTSAWKDYKGKGLSPAQGDLLISQVDRELNQTMALEADTIEEGLSLLAVIATASPFVGLFGTVWGIMNSFAAIASAGDTNLATVAPAISEALSATAMGLFAAIPAYIGFNLFNARVARFSGRMEGFADELMVSLSRRIGDKLGN
ncbi:protein TolQ [Asticcacaulis sp. EMRT-3]|uniref:protein TolQ n=1 Tax=Asticcacaulis sp. EMRT-3 TaxID=3040349 RepID=UPI0024AE94F8|nr:protein TolQ [Asticcacaulis sp. EMRT-3]MDI7775285.1 protein TolQ [Asticcacaulis sp. EMRT-3]